MKKQVLLLILVFGFGLAYAQDEITDDDLKAYAIANAAVKSITSSISPMVNDLIAKQEGMTGQRFKELQGAGGDADKLAAVEAKDWEIKFMEMINGEIEKRKDAAKEVVNLMAKYAMGASTYKAIRSGLSNDPTLQARYSEIEDKLE
ncbi:MAG: hypothetical protein KFF73_12390 [Cyclobacteriaceae bacterium]|nr:hypothetical protein [Cyclobacteriaceae bacterium]